MLIEAKKFSKFVHGCYTLIPKRVRLSPPWLEMLEETMSSPGPKLIPIRRGLSVKFNLDQPSAPKQPKLAKPKDPKKVEDKIPTLAPVKKGDDKNAVELVVMNKGSGDDGEQPKQDILEDVTIMTLPKKLWEKARAWWEKTDVKKQIPMKIEPKTFFANERTFIQWLSFLVLLQSIGVGLVSFGPAFPGWRITGLFFVAVAIVFMIYALLRYERRRYCIARRQRGPYDDRYGPIALVVILIAGLIISIILSFLGTINPCKGLPLLDREFLAYSPYNLLYREKTSELVAVGQNLVTFRKNNGDLRNLLVSGDWRGIAQAPNFPDNLYLGAQSPNFIQEINAKTGEVLRSWQIPPFQTLASTLVSLTFVPDSSNSEGGVFWIGTEKEDLVYVVQFPLNSDPNPSANATGTLLTTFSPVPGMKGIHTLTYQDQDQKIYAIVDRWLLALNTDGSISAQYAQGFNKAAGFTMAGKGKSTVYVSCSSSCNDIFRFSWTDSKGIESGRCKFGNPLPNSNPFVVNQVA